MSADDFFRARLETMIGMRHPLVVPATHMLWKDTGSASASVFAHKDCAGRSVEGADLFGAAAVVSIAGELLYIHLLLHGNSLLVCDLFHDS